MRSASLRCLRRSISVIEPPQEYGASVRELRPNVHGEGRAPLLGASLSTVGLGHSSFGFSLGHVAPIFKERKVDPTCSKISPLTSNDCPRGPRSSTTLIGPRGNLNGGKALIKNPGYGFPASELLVRLQVKVWSLTSRV